LLVGQSFCPKTEAESALSATITDAFADPYDSAIPDAAGTNPIAWDPVRRHSTDWPPARDANGRRGTAPYRRGEGSPLSLVRPPEKCDAISVWLRASTQQVQKSWWDPRPEDLIKTSAY